MNRCEWAGLVKDLLDLARMEAGHVELNLERVEMNELLRRVTHKFQVYSLDRGIRLDYAAPLEAVVLQEADEDRLEQVLTNLLDNAIRHSPDGSTITLSLRDLSNPGWPDGRAYGSG